MQSTPSVAPNPQAAASMAWCEARRRGDAPLGDVGLRAARGQCASLAEETAHKPPQRVLESGRQALSSYLWTRQDARASS